MYNSKKSFSDIDPSQIPVRKPNANEYDKETGSKLTDYKMICELGRGSFGVVHRVLSLVNGNEYVMKKIGIKHMKLNRQKEALKEAQILKKVRHNNIIKYYTSFVEQDYLYIVMEYAESGDLATLIKSYKEKRKHFTEKQIWDFAWELCQALEYLHKNNIIHRDIKTLNIFLSRDGHIKLGDLGVSKIVSSAVALQGTRVGTPLYLSPELVKQLPYDFKVDIWALGCVLYHLAALEAPFIGDNLISLGYNIVNKPPKPLSSAYSTQLTSLIMKFLEKSPTARPKLSEVWSYFPTKYQNTMKNTNEAKDNSNKVEYHSNSVAQLLKIDEEILVQSKNPLKHWMSPDKRNSQIDLPTRPYTANHLQGPYRDNLSPDKNNKGIRSQVYPIKANILSHHQNRHMSPARYTPNMPISSVDESRKSPSLEKESHNGQHIKKEAFQVNHDKVRRISQKEANVGPEESSIEKAIVHRQSPSIPSIEVLKQDNNQKFQSHVPIQRSQTTEVHKVMMNPLISSSSSRIKINSKLGQAPSLQGYFSKPGSDSMPYMFSRPQTAQQKGQKNGDDKAFNARDNEESDDESSDSLETFGDLRKKAYNGMRIRPISANNLVTMQNQLAQSTDNKTANKGLKTALSISTIEKEPKGENTQTKIPESPRQSKQQYGGISPRNRSVSIERPKSAIGNQALNAQLQKGPVAGIAENPSNAKYIKSGYGEWAFGKGRAQDTSEKDQEKIAKFFQVPKSEVNKPEGVLKESPEEKLAYDSAKKGDYKDLLKRNLVNTSLRLDAVAKSMVMKNSMDVSRKNESVMDNGSKEDRLSDIRYQGGSTRPTTAVSSKKRLTIHDLM